MSAKLQKSNEAFWRMNNLRTEIVETELGFDVIFTCCGCLVTFERDPDEEIFARTILDHITETTCSEALQASARPINFCGQATARTTAERSTLKQQIAIRAICRSHGLSGEKLCLEQLKCRPEHLSIRAASAFIDWLKREYAGY